MKYGLLCCYGLLGQYLAEIQIFEIWNLILNLKFLVVHITNQNLHFDIFMIGNLLISS